MKTYLDCIPCFCRQALDAARLVTDDEGVHAQVLRETLRRAADMDFRRSPPEMGQQIHSLIRELTGDGDPYHSIKERYNRFALKLYPELKETIEQSVDPLEAAVRLAIAGNVIDFGVNAELHDAQVHQALEHGSTAPLDGPALGEFRDAVNRAERILYLGDNAGEIVFDRLLIEQMPREKITLVVKGGPIINDATMDDARMTGLCDVVEVIENGSDAPGTILEDCSDEFRARFDDADMIVAKGQGNYETLSDIPKDIFFALKAKCPVIAGDIGCEVGSLVLQGSNPSSVGGNVNTTVARQ